VGEGMKEKVRLSKIDRNGRKRILSEAKKTSIKAQMLRDQ